MGLIEQGCWVTADKFAYKKDTMNKPVKKITIAEFKRAIRQDGNLTTNVNHVNSDKGVNYIRRQITTAVDMGQITRHQADKLMDWAYDCADEVATRLKRRQTRFLDQMGF